MHAILAAMGTDGDVFPFISIGRALLQRGHRVTLAANEGYTATAAAHGLEFAPLLSNQETHEFLTDPSLWHPVKHALVAARLVRFLSRQYDLLASLAGSSDTLLAAHPGVYAARIVSEKLARPMASVVICPWMIASSAVPPIVARGFALPSWAPRPVASGYWRFVDFTGDVLLGREVNRLRGTLDLPPIRRFFQWWMSPEVAIGMFPEWYGPVQPDWPNQIFLAGFPQYDGASDAVPSDVADFCCAGASPLVFTFGSGMMQGSRLFEASLDACDRLQQRALFVTRHLAQLPDLPDSILACVRVPFGWLFPRCAAVIHHGGVGTTARALSAGIPQLVLPIAFDQHDNAARVTRLGVGAAVHSRRSGKRIAAHLQRLLASDTPSHCREIAMRHANETDGGDVAAGKLEELARNAGIA